MMGSVNIATAANGEGQSPTIEPRVGYDWTITEFASEAPPGTDGALLWYLSTGQLLKVEPIGEFTSNTFAPVLLVPSRTPFYVKAVGVPGAGTVRVNYSYEVSQ